MIKYSENNNGYRQCIAGSILGKNMVVKIYKSNYVTVHAVLSDVFWLVHRFQNNYTTHLSANPIAQV